MFTEKRATPKRGRPRGRTALGTATRERLYRKAQQLFRRRGYSETTLRQIARAAKVSPGLLYRYFPSKRAVVLALYDELSARFAATSDQLPQGPWRTRALAALRSSLQVLGAERDTLSALVPVLVGDPAEGLFAPATAFSRERVQEVFVEAVRGATDAPKDADARALGRVLYLMHLAVVLFWLLDRSEEQRATAQLFRLMEHTAGSLALAYRLPWLRSLVRSLDAAATEGLFGELRAPA